MPSAQFTVESAVALLAAVRDQLKNGKAIQIILAGILDAAGTRRAVSINRDDDVEVRRSAAPASEAATVRTVIGLGCLVAGLEAVVAVRRSAGLVAGSG